jgi:hypothetical protein
MSKKASTNKAARRAKGDWTMKWRWLYVTEDMGAVEGIPCSICKRLVHDRIWFPSDFEDATDIQHLLNLWLSDPNLDKELADPYEYFNVCGECKEITPWPLELYIEG